jgi:hypothetical protein
LHKHRIKLIVLRAHASPQLASIYLHGTRGIRRNFTEGKRWHYDDLR